MFLPQSVAVEVLINCPFPVPAGFEGVLSLTSRYRRIMEYFKMLSSRPDLLGSKGIYEGPVEKCLDCIAAFEKQVVETSALLQRGSVVKEDAIAKLDRAFRAMRLLLDDEIRKHCGHTSMVVVRVGKDGLIAEANSIEISGLRGNRAAVFGVFDAGVENGSCMKVRLSDSEEKALYESKIEIFAEGMTPFIADFIIADLPDGTCLDLSDGKSSVSIPVVCKPIAPAVLKCRIIDKEKQEKVACRVRIEDSQSQFQSPLGARTTKVPAPWGGPDWNTRDRFSNQMFFYCDGSFEMEIAPGKVSLRCVKGFEYEVSELTIDVQSGEVKSVDIEMSRVIDMPVWGWHAGQTHVHSQNLMPVNDYSGWQVIPDAEGLEISFLSTFHQNEEIFSNEYPAGLIEKYSRQNYYLLVGEEFRHVPFGHMTFLNLKSLVPPISSGRLGARSWPDTPCNAQAIDLAHEQGAVAVYCHLDACGPLVMNDELPIDAALGKVDCGEAMGAGGGFRYWYPMLNCGIRMGACAGPDWNLEDCCRVYVHTGSEGFTLQEWMDGLKAQRTFVTTGPMLFLTVNDEKPGSVISGDSAKRLRIKAHAISTDLIGKVEIVINGKVAKYAESAAGECDLTVEMDFEPEMNCWIAARCWGEGNAHTSPVYVELDDRPMGTAEDAGELLAISEKCIRWTEENGVFPSHQEKEHVLAMFRKGADFYRRIVDAG